MTGGLELLLLAEGAWSAVGTAFEDALTAGAVPLTAGAVVLTADAVATSCLVSTKVEPV